MSLWDEKETSMPDTAKTPKRSIGITHRVKWTAKGEARPTLVAIIGKGKETKFKLETEQDELDFVLGVLPTSWRALETDEDLPQVKPHHIRWKKCSEEETAALPPSRVKKEGKQFYLAERVPATYEGLRNGDTVAMAFGGSGDYLAFALSRQGMKVGATVLRIPSFILKKERGVGDKDTDANLLASLIRNRPELFRPVSERDQNLIRVREHLRARVDAMKARIACEQRLRQRFIGAIFCNPKGLYPEGAIEKAFNEEKANDEVLQALLKEEGRRERELVKALETTDVWHKVFKPIEGCGPMTAAPLIAAIGDIRRFPTGAKLKAFCGVHVLPDGRFPRQRSGELANWSPQARQALYLLGEQFNLRPNSLWGQYLRRIKEEMRKRHPHPIPEERDGGKIVRRWTDAHVHRTATWRTLSRFVEKLHCDWSRIAANGEQANKAA